MAGRHKKPTKRERHGIVTGIGDRVRTPGRKARRGEVIGWDMRDPRRVVYFVREVKK